MQCECTKPIYNTYRQSAESNNRMHKTHRTAHCCRAELLLSQIEFRKSQLELQLHTVLECPLAMGMRHCSMLSRFAYYICWYFPSSAFSCSCRWCCVRIAAHRMRCFFFFSILLMNMHHLCVYGNGFECLQRRRSQLPLELRGCHDRDNTETVWIRSVFECNRT